MRWYRERHSEKGFTLYIYNIQHHNTIMEISFGVRENSLYRLHVFSLFICVITITERCFAQTERPPDYNAAVYKYVMNNTNKQTRPPGDPSEPTRIFVAFIVSRISTLDEKQEIMKTFGIIATAWYNPYYIWDPADYGGVEEITIPASEVWLPEITLLNGVEDENDQALDSKFRVTVRNDGYTTWTPSFRWVTTCALDLWRFPFDKQTCSVQFVNWVHTKRAQVFLNVMPNVSTELVQLNGAWILEGTKTGAYDMQITPYPNEYYPVVYFDVMMRRRSEYYIWNIIMPVSIISLMSSMVFLLPAESGEKVSLQITVLLGYTVIMLMLSDILPRSSLNMPLLIQFSVLNMACTAVCMVFTVIVVKLFHMMPTREVPGWLRAIMLRGLGTILCVGGCGTTASYAHKHSDDHSSAEQLSDYVHSLRRMRVHIPRHVDETIKKVWYEERKGDAMERNREEWKMISRVLDRFFMIVFLIIFLAFLAVFLYMLSVSNA